QPFPPARVLRDVGLAERAGEALDRAVHEELDAAKLEPRVVEALAEQLLVRHEKVVIDEEGRPDAPAALVHRLAVRPVRFGPRGGAAVVGRGDAESQEHLLERRQPVLQIRRGALGQGAPYRGYVAENTREVARSRVTVDDAALGIRRVLPDTEEIERARIGDAGVSPPDGEVH